MNRFLGGGLSSPTLSTRHWSQQGHKESPTLTVNGYKTTPGSFIRAILLLWALFMGKRQNKREDKRKREGGGASLESPAVGGGRKGRRGAQARAVTNLKDVRNMLEKKCWLSQCATKEYHSKHSSVKQTYLNRRKRKLPLQRAGQLRKGFFYKSSAEFSFSTCD